jgi:uncharacterized Ntn-hydrolase superfamily protein
VYGRPDHGTFSLVACDDDRKFWGVIVATKPTSVGAVVPWARWPFGGLATQAESNYHYGPRGLELLAKRRPAAEVVRRLTDADPKREHRQLGVVDALGRSAAWTGSKCRPWAGHLTGDGYACQGNILRSERVVPAMARAFEEAEGTLARRLYAALRAGARAGGDRRGMESAAIVVVHRERWFDPAWSDRWVDLRVDQHAGPVEELGRLLRREEAGIRRFLARRARLGKSADSGAGPGH